MAAKVKDDEGKQRYVDSFPEVFPDGSEFSVYASEENRRLIIKHASGSHIEFKEDGSIFVKANKNLHVDCGRESESLGDSNSGTASTTTITCDTDMLLNVTGELKVRAKRLDVKAPDGIYTDSSGGETKIQANNTVIGAHENMSIQPTKSLYISTGEMRENVTSKTTEAGSSPNGVNPAVGGQIVHRTMGHFVLENMDPKGGITIKSAGYTNILTAAERIDLTGNPDVALPMFDPTPAGVATYTHIVAPYPGPTPKGIPGSAFFGVGPGGYTEILGGPVTRSNTGITTHNYTGKYIANYSPLKTTNITGKELINVIGDPGEFIVNAPAIFLN